MPKLKLTDEQAMELLQQLPAAQRWALFLKMAKEAGAGREARRQKGEAELRKLAAAKGLNWDTMSDQDKEDFVDDLIHEDRGCR